MADKNYGNVYQGGYPPQGTPYTPQGTPYTPQGTAPAPAPAGVYVPTAPPPPASGIVEGTVVGPPQPVPPQQQHQGAVQHTHIEIHQKAEQPQATVVQQQPECWNIYWLLFILGWIFPLIWIGGSVGVCSGRTPCERQAGIVNIVFIVLLVLALIGAVAGA